MGHDLPCGGFEFLIREEINDFNLDSVAENSQVGHILEVDLKYCKELHDLHSNYPLCPEKIEFNYDMLSKYCKELVIGTILKLVVLKNWFLILVIKLSMLFITDIYNIIYH